MGLTPAVQLTRHAECRVQERSELTPAQVQFKLETGQYAWACPPRPHLRRYALLYDTRTDAYSVAVLAPDSFSVITLLTLAQYENTAQPVEPILRLMARFATAQALERLAAQERQTREEQAAAVQRRDALQAAMDSCLWQFTVHLANGSQRLLAPRSHGEVCRDWHYCLPPTHKESLRRRAKRVVRTQAFQQWLLNALAAQHIALDDVCALEVTVLMQDGSVIASIPLTQTLAHALTDPHPETTLRKLACSESAARARVHGILALQPPPCRNRVPAQPAPSRCLGAVGVHA